MYVQVKEERQIVRQGMETKTKMSYRCRGVGGRVLAILHRIEPLSCDVCVVMLYCCVVMLLLRSNVVVV